MVLFLPKDTNFLQKKNAYISKIKGVLVLKGIFSEPTYGFVLSFKFLAYLEQVLDKERGGSVIFTPHRKTNP